MGSSARISDSALSRRLPPWLKRPPPSGRFAHTKAVVARSGVATVCHEARCPNRSECWSARNATFMILGKTCTRGCRFCAVDTGRPLPPKADEPHRVAQAVAELELRHVVLTAVARDDLEDEGSGHFAQCVTAVRRQCPDTSIEVLPADFHARPDCIATLCDAKPELYNHNLEMVEWLSPALRPQAGYRRSLDVLHRVKEIAPTIITKSGLMVGLGETVDELHRTLEDLRGVGCEVVTIGQYLAPTLNGHAAVDRYYRPEEFESLAELARNLGFLGVASGPFVRSSYNALEVFQESRRRIAQERRA